MICIFKTRLQTLQCRVWFLIIDRAPNQLVKSYFLCQVVHASSSVAASIHPTRVIAIETLFSQVGILFTMVPALWLPMWGTMSCHTLLPRQGNNIWPKPFHLPFISSGLLDWPIHSSKAGAYHHGITATLTTSRFFWVADFGLFWYWSRQSGVISHCDVLRTEKWCQGCHERQFSWRNIAFYFLSFQVKSHTIRVMIQY